ncbi:MAG: hypothetical protein JXA77_01190 [Bacteroidales bacterium]|nr:hypothetical protein [Bacteroidales bacterium]
MIKSNNPQKSISERILRKWITNLVSMTLKNTILTIRAGSIVQGKKLDMSAQKIMKEIENQFGIIDEVQKQILFSPEDNTKIILCKGSEIKLFTKKGVENLTKDKISNFLIEIMKGQ